MIVAVTIFVLLIMAYFFLIEPRKPMESQYKPFCGINYAHRGLHSKDMSVPENSIKAFEAAAEAGYGIELDVRTTKDGQIVVFHDETLNRMCAADGRVDELTYDQLLQYNLGGTDEKIPLLSQVLDVVDDRVKIIVELKTVPDRKRLCSKTHEIIKDRKNCCIESFDPRIVGWFNRHSPNTFRGQLVSSYEEMSAKEGKFKAFIISNIMLNFIGRPHFIAHSKGKKTVSVALCEWLGAKKFAWTVTDQDKSKEYEMYNNAVIFQYYLPEKRFYQF